MIQSKKQKVTSWSKEQTCRLMEEIQKHPLLYDQMHPYYQHRAHRFSALRTVIANLKPIKPNISAEMISRKLKVLRHQYYKEKRCVENPPENLYDIHGRYQPRLWCYELLKFLDKRGKYPVEQPPLTVRKEQEEVQVEDVDDIIEETNDPFEEVEISRVEQQHQTESENHSQRRNALHTKCLKLVEILSKEMKTAKAPTTNSIAKCNQQSPKTFLGLMVESELSTVSDDIYHDAKWRIIRILEEAATKEREKKTCNTQSGSTTASALSSNSSYSIGGETRVTVLDNGVLKVMEINKLNQSN